MSIIATTPMMGIKLNTVTVFESHPVVFALNIWPNATGISIAVSRIVTNTPITFSSIGIFVSFPPLVLLQVYRVALINIGIEDYSHFTIVFLYELPCPTLWVLAPLIIA